MKFVQKEFTATLEEKKSKFLAFLVPYKDFDKTMQRLRMSIQRLFILYMLIDI